MSRVPRSPVTLVVTGIMVFAVSILAFAAVSFAFLYRMDSAVEEAKDATDENRQLLEAEIEANKKLTELVEAQRRAESLREERLDEAVKLVDDALQKRLSEHDADMVFLNEVLLYQIAQLINRPAGVTSDPVTAKALGGDSTSGSRSPTATDRTTRPAATTTTTTTPDQRNCAKRPNGPRC